DKPLQQPTVAQVLGPARGHHLAQVGKNGAELSASHGRGPPGDLVTPPNSPATGGIEYKFSQATSEITPTRRTPVLEGRIPWQGGGGSARSKKATNNEERTTENEVGPSFSVLRCSFFVVRCCCASRPPTRWAPSAAPAAAGRSPERSRCPRPAP